MKRSTRSKKKLLPSKYYRGLTPKQALERKAEIKKFGTLDWKDPKAYVGFKTDKYATKKKTSSYTTQWRALFPDAKSLEDKSKATGVPLKYIDHVYRKGLGAWRTGHRPGATEAQWGYARVHSFLLCGKTYDGPDSSIANDAKQKSVKAKKWFKRCGTRKR